jgi:hypothetical protein
MPSSIEGTPTTSALVEPVDKLGPPLRFERQCIEQTVDMLVGLGSALRREPRRLVEHDRVLIAMDHHRQRQLGIFRAERRADALWPFGALHDRRGGHLLDFERRDADRLPGGNPVARLGALAVDAQLARARPARDEAEADIGLMPLEPAIEPDAVVVIADGKGAAGLAHPKILVSITPQYSINMEPATDDTA